MILAVDVYYQEPRGFAAAVSFEHWDAVQETRHYTETVEQVAPYQSGQFYKRELPCILQLLRHHQLSPDYILVDGHVYLDVNQKPALGKYLYDALEKNTIVIGVAKQAFHSTPSNFSLLRGNSKKPLYISAAGLDLQDAKQLVASMHGNHRIPDLLKKTDRLCRSRASQ